MDGADGNGVDGAETSTGGGGGKNDGDSEFVSVPVWVAVRVTAPVGLSVALPVRDGRGVRVAVGTGVTLALGGGVEVGETRIGGGGGKNVVLAVYVAERVSGAVGDTLRVLNAVGVGNCDGF